MVLFAVTGITLNHAGQIEAQPQVTLRTAQLPEPLRAQWADAEPDATARAGLQQWLRDQWQLRSTLDGLEWDNDELYLPLPRPGGDGWLSADLTSGEVEYEVTDRGWISWLNDLHKGRNTGLAWSWFLDLFAVACLVFSLTGLLLLYLHGRQRPGTWPVVGLGLVIPLLLIVLFMHA